MEKQSKIEWLDVYEVRKILTSRGLSVPMGKEGYETIVENGFAFDMSKYLWYEKSDKNTTA